MSGVAAVLEDLHEAEAELHLELQQVGLRHSTDAEVAGGLRALANWSESHVERLADEGRRFGLALGHASGSATHPALAVRRRSGELLVRRSADAARLVGDLRQVFVDASLVELDWELLGELARIHQDCRLVVLAERSRVETHRQLTWVETRLKQAVVHAMTDEP